MALAVRIFLDKIYFELRNLGYTSSDRALNYAGTNAFMFIEGIVQGLAAGNKIPGMEPVLYSLDTINVSKSPYCRLDSDCWDVQISFFNPNNDRQARVVWQYTIDVSDEMPVSLAPRAPIPYNGVIWNEFPSRDTEPKRERNAHDTSIAGSTCDARPTIDLGKAVAGRGRRDSITVSL